MIETISLFVAFDGGFVVAFGLLLFATLARPRPRLIWMSVMGAFCGLLYKGGCNALASGFAKAVGGGGSDSRMNNVFEISVSVAVIWSLVILARSAERESKKPEDKGKTGGTQPADDQASACL